MCVNPVSMSVISSASLCATLHMKLSFVSSHKAWAVFSYITVDSMLLCPRIFCTWRRSPVSWYNIVPFQWRSVWNPIFAIRGLLSFSANFLRCVSK